MTGIDSSKKMFEHSTTTNHATTTTFHTFCGHDEPVNKATMNNHDDDVVVEYKCVCVCVSIVVEDPFDIDQPSLPPDECLPGIRPNHHQ